jgi:alpha-glucosidase
MSGWWREAVFYQVYPRSFADGNGDGVGDLVGLRSRLDHLSWLGVDAIWLSPIYPSPMADFGYDVSDYCGVDPVFGTLADFDALLADVHGRGMRLILDWVGNHTSIEHPWFGSHPDWYVWRDSPGGSAAPPNNWLAAFGGSAWTWDEDWGQWYLHFFLDSQPDLNWANPEVPEAMHQTMRFWLDRGVDGFRLDVPHCMGKDPTFADNAAEVAHIRRSRLNDCAATHPILRGLRAVVDEYDDRMMVGEVNLLTVEQLGAYVGSADEPELQLVFNFLPFASPWSASEWRGHIETASLVFDGDGLGWPTWFLSNHDYSRHRSRYGGSEDIARAAAVLLLTLRGTPFLYQGEELGLEDALVLPSAALDPGGRDGCRAPVPWEAGPGAGWPVDGAWLPLPPDAQARSAAVMRDSAGSILHLYRSLIALRRSSPALVSGDLVLLDVGAESVVAYRRSAGEDVRVVLVNFSAASARPVLEGSWSVAVASWSGGAAGRWDGVLPGLGAVVLQPVLE